MTDEDEDPVVAALRRRAAEAPPILGADGRPARPVSRGCPRCGAGPDERRDRSGFGPAAAPVCSRCGYVDDEGAT